MCECVIVCVWHPCISVTPHWDHNEDKAQWSLLIQHLHSSPSLYPSLPHSCATSTVIVWLATHLVQLTHVQLEILGNIRKMLTC